MVPFELYIILILCREYIIKYCSPFCLALSDISHIHRKWLIISLGNVWHQCIDTVIDASRESLTGVTTLTREGAGLSEGSIIWLTEHNSDKYIHLNSDTSDMLNTFKSNQIQLRLLSSARLKGHLKNFYCSQNKAIVFLNAM